jgi:hypothetical protein
LKNTLNMKLRGKDIRLLGYDTVIWQVPNNDLKDCSAFQTSAAACKKTQHHISEDLNFQFATTLL